MVHEKKYCQTELKRFQTEILSRNVMYFIRKQLIFAKKVNTMLDDETFCVYRAMALANLARMTHKGTNFDWSQGLFKFQYHLQCLSETEQAKANIFLSIAREKGHDKEFISKFVLDFLFDHEKVATCLVHIWLDTFVLFDETLAEYEENSETDLEYLQGMDLLKKFHEIRGHLNEVLGELK